MASGDTKTEHLLDVLANGSRADIPADNCCNTKTQNYILGAVNRMVSLEEEVEELQNNPDVTDIVSTYQDLTNYDKTTLTDGDVIRVLTDSTHDDESAYYRYNAATDSFDYIGTTRAYTDFVGTSGGMAGAAGLVPAPQATDVDKYLKSDGTWATVSGGGGGTTNYNSMTNKPSINGVELIGNKSLEDLGISGVTEEQLDEAIDDERTAREAADTAINGRLDKNVSDLKSATSVATNNLSLGQVGITSWHVGKRYSQNISGGGGGVLQPFANAICSVNYLPIKANISYGITLKQGFSAQFRLYDSNGICQGSYNLSAANNDVSVTHTFEATYPNIKLNVVNNDGSAIATIDYASNITIKDLSFDEYASGVTSQFYAHDIAIDKLSLGGIGINSLFVGKRYDISGNLENFKSAICTKEYLPLRSGKTYTITCAQGYLYQFRIYNEAGVFQTSYNINASSASQTVDHQFEGLVMLNITNSDNTATATLDYAKNIEIVEKSRTDYLSDKLFGKSVFCDGDSVAYGHMLGASFIDAIAAKHDMVLTKVAVNGGTIASGVYNDGVARHWVSTSIESFEDQDFCVICGGYNDWSREVPLGTITNGIPVLSSLDKETFIGALEYIMLYMVTNHPSARVLYVIEHKSAAWNTTKPNTQLKFAAYRDAIIAVCEKYSVDFVDIWVLGTLALALDDNSIGTYTQKDEGTIHPNAAGYALAYNPFVDSALQNAIWIG